jgi:hypothetical protein
MLKAGLRLTELLQRTSRPQEAHEIIEECLARLPEGLDLPEVGIAKAIARNLADGAH